VYHPHARWYTPGVPTSRPRYQVTETDEVARALDAAERRWPGEPRSKLLVRLVVEGGAKADEVDDEIVARRRAALARAGDLGIRYPAGYLSALRDEWPT
jgi:hypothetical protein